MDRSPMNFKRSIDIVRTLGSSRGGACPAWPTRLVETFRMKGQRRRGSSRLL
jgi:hypothetical protein